MTKTEHILDEVKRICQTISGVTAYTESSADTQGVHPFIKILGGGEGVVKKSERGSVKITEQIVMLDVHIAKQSGSTLTDERNRLANAIEYAFDVNRVADYTDAQYRVNIMQSDVVSCSPVLDDNRTQSNFIVTVAVEYQSTLVI